MNSRLAQTAGFLHPGQPRRRAAAVNPAADPTRPTKLDRGEHRHTIHSGGTHPSKINNRLHRKLDSLPVELVFGVHPVVAENIRIAFDDN